AFDKVEQDSGITGQQYNILRILRGAQPNGHACGDIADRMVEPSPDITRRIDSLEKEGLVVRERSKEDRRVVITRITPKGMALLDKATPILQEAQRCILDRLNKKESEELTRLCEKL